MKSLPLALLVAAFALGPARAAEPAAAPAAPPPSVESVRALFEAMHADTLMESAKGDVERMMHAQVDQATAGRQLSDGQRAAIDETVGKMVKVVQDALNWKAFELYAVDIYQQSFSQAEVDSLVAFFRSPAGQAYAQKLPLVQQKTMQSMVQYMQPMMQKLQQLSGELDAKLKAQAPAAAK